MTAESQGEIVSVRKQRDKTHHIHYMQHGVRHTIIVRTTGRNKDAVVARVIEGRNADSDVEIFQLNGKKFINFEPVQERKLELVK